MSHNSFQTAEVVDLDALMNSQVVAKDVGGTIVGGQVANSVPQLGAVGSGNGEATPGVGPASQPNPPPTQNSQQTPSLPHLDLSRPVKTEGEASPSMSTVSQPPHPAGASLLPASQRARTSTTDVSGVQATPSDPLTTSTTTTTPSSLPVSVASIGTFGSPLTALGAQLKLTPEEQAAAYKKANILALSALAKKGGPNAREMLAVQAKLQEFLTNLISLAGNSGQQLKSTVQFLVQQLVTGSISEQEFAMRIEKDLHSQHQPSLLPFLQNSVPHLRTRLQLQQAIMKELLQRQAQEKLQRKLQEQQKMAQGISLASVSASGTKNTTHGASVSPQGVQPPMVDMLGPASAPGKPAQLQSQRQNLKLNDVAGGLTSSPTAATASLPLPASVPLPISTTSITAQLRERLAKMTPQQRLLYMQQLKMQASSQSLQPKQQQPLQQQQKQQQQIMQRQNVAQLSSSGQQTTVNQAILLASTAQAAKANSIQSLPQFPPSSSSSSASSSSPSAVLNSSTTATAMAAARLTVTQQTPNIQQVLEQQQRLVKQQQQQVALTTMGTTAAAMKSTTSRLSVASSPVGGPNSLLAARSTAGASGTPPKGSQSRTSFADIKLVAGGVGKSASPPVSGKGKGKVKTEAGKAAAEDDEEEDDEMDFSGVKTVNLQAESMLPTNLGETMRTVQDEAFFELRPLKHKVQAIARRYGITEVTDDFLVLLSHGVQERLRDVLEKVTIVSQHRTEPLKDESRYEVVSEVKGQLKVLESIDRLSHKRKQEREKEQILKAARSRSRAEDPEAAAKIKEQAKKLQQEEEQKIRDRAANEAALAAIGSGTKRKRLSAAGPSDGAAPGTSGLLSSLGSDTGSGHTSLLGAQTSRQPKRRVTARDLLFYMEQTKETKKSLVLYKSLLK